MSISFTPLKKFKKFLVPGLFIGGALLVLLVAWLWWARLSTNPERVFWGTIERGMATSSVTLVSERDNGGTTMRQVSAYSLGATNITHATTHLEQGGTTIVNETIGTPDTDYSRYLSIQTDQKKPDGTPYDTSRVIGVWAQGEEGSGQLFRQAILGSSLPLGGTTIPLGNLDHEARTKLMAQIRKDGVYDVAFDKVKKEHKDGRLLYAYDVNIQPGAYAALIKQFTADLGVDWLQQLDPSQYTNEQPLRIQFVIDVRAQRVVKAIMPEYGYEQTYASYGVPVHVAVPKQTIPIDELQQRF